MPLTEYILGFPTGKTDTKENVTPYSDMQDAASSTSFVCSVFAESLDQAKEKFITVYEKENKKVATPHIVSVTEQLRSNHSFGVL